MEPSSHIIRPGGTWNTGHKSQRPGEPDHAVGTLVDVGGWGQMPLSCSLEGQAGDPRGCRAAGFPPLLSGVWSLHCMRGSSLCWRLLGKRGGHGEVNNCHQARLGPFSLTEPKRLTSKTRVTRVPGCDPCTCFCLAFLKVLCAWGRAWTERSCLGC